MPRRIAAGFLIAACLAVGAADARVHRSGAARDEFKRLQPCPATGKPKGPCPGFIIDHVIPLCAGGPDDPANMQWQTAGDAKAKDRIERQECRRK